MLYVLSVSSHLGFLASANVKLNQGTLSVGEGSVANWSSKMLERLTTMSVWSAGPYKALCCLRRCS
jgi:hypothetical protein